MQTLSMTAGLVQKEASATKEMSIQSLAILGISVQPKLIGKLLALLVRTVQLEQLLRRPVQLASTARRIVHTSTLSAETVLTVHLQRLNRRNAHLATSELAGLTTMTLRHLALAAALVSIPHSARIHALTAGLATSVLEVQPSRTRSTP